MSTKSSLLSWNFANHTYYSLTVGAAVRLRGNWVPCEGRAQHHELQVTKTSILGPSNAKVRVLGS
jgi:hypothetical protein